MSSDGLWRLLPFSCAGAGADDDNDVQQQTKTTQQQTINTNNSDGSYSNLNENKIHINYNNKLKTALRYKEMWMDGFRNAYNIIISQEESEGHRWLQRIMLW